MSMGLANIEKAAVLLMSLGREQAAEVMKQLTENEVKKLSRAFITVREVGRDVQQSVANEFSRMLRAADTLVVDGTEFAKDVITSAFGNEAGDSLLNYLSGSRKESLASLLNDVPKALVESFINSEHPQTIAFVLSKMTPDVAADMLEQMSGERQIDVLLRMSQMDDVKSEVIDEVREAINLQLRGISLGSQDEVNGPQAVADLLNFVDSENEERILAELEEMHPELAEEIRNLMFTFNDLLSLDDRAMQTVLKEVPRETLVVALKTASEELKDLIFKNISQRAAQMLQEDLETLGPIRLKEVEKTQQGIIDIVRRLEAEGKIQIAQGGGDVLV